MIYRDPVCGRKGRTNMLKGDLRRQAILDTAETLFFEKGYVKATIQDFLDALECSKGSCNRKQQYRITLSCTMHGK